MAPPRKSGIRVAPTLDIPVLTEVVEETVAAEVVPAPAAEPAANLSEDILSEMLTERIAALTDRLLRDASAEIHTMLVEKVWERLREEIPAIVEAALKENGRE